MLVIAYMAPNNLNKDIGNALTIAVEIIVILIVPILAGRYLDQILGTNFIVIIFILLAVGLVFFRLIKMSSKRR
jgi:F0F1-type ATP synthase assembly protein I